MTATTRLAAAAAGLTRYNTGRPCRNGHVADRYTSTGNCSECLKDNNRQLAATLRQAKTPDTTGGRLFTYRLHPDDHAAALAFCQALDLQRGRQPQASQAVVAQELPPVAAPGAFPLPAWLAAARNGQDGTPPGVGAEPANPSPLDRMDKGGPT
jgi:hypothetical protein